MWAGEGEHSFNHLINGDQHVSIASCCATSSLLSAGDTESMQKINGDKGICYTNLKNTHKVGDLTQQNYPMISILAPRCLLVLSVCMSVCLCLSVLLIRKRANERVQWVKMLATQPDNLRSTHGGGRELTSTNYSLTPTHVPPHHTQTQTAS